MNSFRRISAIVFFLSLYCVTLVYAGTTNSRVATKEEAKFKKAVVSIDKISSKSVFSPVEIQKEFSECNSAKISDFSTSLFLNLSLFRKFASQSKLKQYSFHWYNQLILQRITQQLFPQHNFW